MQQTIILLLLVAIISSTSTQAFFLSSSPLTSSSPRSSRSSRSLSRVTMSAVATPPTTPPAPGAAAAARPRREINVLQLVESNGGYLAKVQVKNFKDVTEHTVITSKELYHETCEIAGKPAFPINSYFQAVFKYIISKGMPLTRTEGMIDAGIFPINYFSVSQLAIFMDDTVEGVAEVIKGM